MNVTKSSRVLEFTTINVKALRKSLHKSQSEFASQNDRCQLSHAANWLDLLQALLRVVQLQPDAVLKALAT
jgi:hypothetical protein